MIRALEACEVSHVVPYIGTWIETLEALPVVDRVTVVPYIGTWIETSTIAVLTVVTVSYLI